MVSAVALDAGLTRRVENAARARKSAYFVAKHSLLREILRKTPECAEIQTFPMVSTTICGEFDDRPAITPGFA
jgi:hypothetical protein